MIQETTDNVVVIVVAVMNGCIEFDTQLDEQVMHI